MSATAFAAGKPAVATGGHSALTQTSVVLQGKVNPESLVTSYFFQYGTSKAYGTQTGPMPAGSGDKTVGKSAPVIGLTPNTTYHYRIVAINNAGTVLGGDQSFTTLKQPLGLSLLATVNPVPFGGPTTINATLTGTDNANRTIVLEQRPFPYTAPFAVVGNTELTSSTGTATFPILGLAINTQYVAAISGAKVSSPVLTVGSAVIVHMSTHSHSFHSGSTIKFSGTVTPKEDGALYAIQKLRGTLWVGIAGSSLHAHSGTDSSFSQSIKLKHSGSYRIYVGSADGGHQSAAGTPITLKVIPHKH